ncbi:MAG TPA: hypothetical protein VIJ71_03305, partial [Mycobacteriales bacterium]
MARDRARNVQLQSGKHVEVGHLPRDERPAAYPSKAAGTKLSADLAGREVRTQLGVRDDVHTVDGCGLGRRRRHGWSICGRRTAALGTVVVRYVGV